MNDLSLQPMTQENLYEPPDWLRDPHLQTFVNSRIRKPWLQFRTVHFESAASTFILTLSNNTRLKAVANLQRSAAPTIVIIAGLFGDYRSGYVLSAASYLWQQGFSIVRLMLKDHGDTAHLNRDVFSAADIEEVSDALTHITRCLSTGETGVLGFSMGGNFALRLNMLTGIKTLAVCPLLAPASAIQRIDQNWLYRRFFVAKWRKVIRQKQLAFPELTELTEALKLTTLSGLTRFFAERYSDYENIEAHFAGYTLTSGRLRFCTATALYASDDPVIPVREYQQLESSLSIIRSRYGGHCAFLNDMFGNSWIDKFAAEFFDQLKYQAA